MQLMFDIGWTLSRFVGSVIMGAKTEGQSHIPKEGGFILAPNHISYFDPPLCGSFVPRRVHFFAKKELYENPLMAFILSRINVHPIKRGVFDRGAITTAVRLLQEGKPIAVFPEGTRGSRFEFLEPKAGIGMIARKAEVPIVPCFVEGTETPWEAVKRNRRIRICYGPPISADWIRSLPSSKEAWLQIADEVMSRLVAMRDEIRGEAVVDAHEKDAVPKINAGKIDKSGGSVDYDGSAAEPLRDIGLKDMSLGSDNSSRVSGISGAEVSGEKVDTRSRDDAEVDDATEARQ